MTTYTATFGDAGVSVSHKIEARSGDSALNKALRWARSTKEWSDDHIPVHIMDADGGTVATGTYRPRG